MALRSFGERIISKERREKRERGRESKNEGAKEKEREGEKRETFPKDTVQLLQLVGCASFRLFYRPTSFESDVTHHGLIGDLSIKVFETFHGCLKSIV